MELSRPQMTILRMCFAWWLSKAINTHSQYVILFAFPQQQLHERASTLRYTHIAVLTITRILMVVSICAVTRCSFHVVHSYNQCINQQMHLIKYNS